MLVSTLFVQAILATAAFAFPSSKTRFDARASSISGSPRISSDTGTSSNDTFSGAVLRSDNEDFTEVTGTFIIPTFTPVGDSSSQGAVAFVSIGAADCGTGDIFVAGVIVSLSNSSEVTAGAFSTASNAFTPIADFDVDVGDSITLTVTASSATSATAVIKNSSKAKTVSNSLSSSGPLCLNQTDISLSPFALLSGASTTVLDFDKLTFTDVSVKTTSGAADLKDALVFNLEQNDKTVVRVKAEHSKVRFEHA